MNIFFLIPSSTIRTSSSKKIKTIVGGQERVDVYSRILLNIFKWKDRTNAKFTLIFYLSHPEENLTYTIPLDNLSISIETELDAMNFMVSILGSSDVYSVKREKQTFSRLLEKLSLRYNFFYLTSSGKDISELDEELTNLINPCFILGSQLDLTENQERDLLKFDPVLTSVGDKEYLASHVIAIINHHLYAKLQRDRKLLKL